VSEYTKEPRESFKGKQGETIARGDRVAAAVRVGNTADLRVGVVQDIYYAKHEYLSPRTRVVIQFEGAERPSTMENTYNITKLEEVWNPEPAPEGFDHVRLEVQIRGRKLGVQNLVAKGSWAHDYVFAIKNTARQAADAIEGSFE
jgi:hypothetical protein